MTSGNGARPAARDWRIYRGTGVPRAEDDLAALLPEPPPWRRFDGEPVQPPPQPDDTEADRRLGGALSAGGVPADPHEVEMVNAALLLRRPLLVTGPPGIGKSSLAHRVARELGLGPVLHWTVTSRSTLAKGLYDYDAIGRAQATAAAQRQGGTGDEGTEIGRFIKLGPLGTALLASDLPRVLLIDELDKGDVDLPNDLLHVFEQAEYDIPELARARDRMPEATVYTADRERQATIVAGHVRARAFPFVVITSNGERAFPAPFLRRCLRLTMTAPGAEQLAAMVAAHFRQDADSQQRELIDQFVKRSQQAGGLAADQLLNAVYLTSAASLSLDVAEGQRVLDALWQELTGP